MKWQVAVDGRTIEIDSEQLASVTQVEPGVYSVLLDGASYEIRLIETSQGLSAEVGGRRFAVEVRDPRDASRGSRAARWIGASKCCCADARQSGPRAGERGRRGGCGTGPGGGGSDEDAKRDEGLAPRPRDRNSRARGETVGAGDTLVDICWNRFWENGSCPILRGLTVSRSRSWLAILLVGAAVIVAWVATKKAAPPEVEFVKVTRETLISSLSTNGKVEPIEWMPVRSERSGLITRVLVSRGQQVAKDQPLVELDTRVASADLAKAQAAIQEAKAQQQVLTQGGRIGGTPGNRFRISPARGWIWRLRRKITRRWTGWWQSKPQRVRSWIPRASWWISSS